MQIPRRKSEELRARDNGPLYLTEDGLERLKGKLAYLRGALPNLIAETQRTASYGDRSDSAEYKDAKSTLRRTNRQILTIRDQIKRAAVIKSRPKASGKIGLGSTVVLEINGKEKIFQLVGPFETDPSHGRISHESPLGAALINHAKGDIVIIETGRGSQKYLIIEIQ